MPPAQLQPVKIPPPRQIETSQFWDGNDGPWASFIIELPGDERAQQIHVLPSTSLAQTYVISQDGCSPPLNNYTYDKFYECDRSRGSYYKVTQGLEDKANKGEAYITDISRYMVVGEYGFRNINVTYWPEDVTFGYKNKANLVVRNTTVGMISDYRFTWMGLLGLDPQLSNHTAPSNSVVAKPGSDVERTSLLQSMKDTNIIPSVSWAYHAGSRAHDPSGPHGFGSLIFGGYQDQRFKPNGVEFNFHSDEEKAISARVIGMSLFMGNNAGAKRRNLSFPTSDKSFVTRIDSTRPYLYLPREACNEIETSLGLTWNQDSQHYFISNEVHARLLKENPSLEFTLAPLSLPVGDGVQDTRNSTKITLSYKAMALELGFPWVKPGTKELYFPIKPSDNVNQYVLGRAFLQESYLIANYERKSFSINQVDWTGVAKDGKTIPILPASMNEYPKYLITSRNSSKLASGAIAGIVVGILLLITLFLAFFCFKRREAKKRKLEEEKNEARLKLDTNLQSPAESAASPATAVINSATSAESVEKLHEADGTPIAIVELHNKSIVELPDTSGVMSVHYKDVELDASPQEEVFEMEGTPVSAEIKVYEKGKLVQVQGPMKNNQGLRPPYRDDIPASPIPKTPAEYYGRGGRRKFMFTKEDLKRYQGMDSVIASSSNDERPPASAIPQTPVEYYGRNIPEYRKTQSKIGMIDEKELPSTISSLDSIEPNRPLGKIEEKEPESTVSSLGSGEASNNSRLQVPNISPLRQHPVSPADSTNLPPASPIPQTPLEFYGKLPAYAASAEKRKWVGRAPEVPLVILIPATPVDQPPPPLPLRSAARERRPPGAWETDSESGNSSKGSPPMPGESPKILQESPKVPQESSRTPEESLKKPVETTNSPKGNAKELEESVKKPAKESKDSIA